MNFDSAISIETGLERAGVAQPFIGPDLWSDGGCVGRLSDA